LFRGGCTGVNGAKPSGPLLLLRGGRPSFPGLEDPVEADDPEPGGDAPGGPMREAAQVSSPKRVYLIMKLKLPLLDLWLVTGRRLRAGHAYRYQRGYAKGWAAGSAEASGDAAEVRPHSGTVPDEGDPPATQPSA